MISASLDTTAVLIPTSVMKRFISLIINILNIIINVIVAVFTQLDVNKPDSINMDHFINPEIILGTTWMLVLIINVHCLMMINSV